MPRPRPPLHADDATLELSSTQQNAGPPPPLNVGSGYDDAPERSPTGSREPVIDSRNSRIVALTGSSSFLGASLVALLEEDDRVARIVAIDVRVEAHEARDAKSKTKSYEVDFTQPTAEARLAAIFSAERVDTIVHLAFLTSPSHASAWAHEVESVGTMHVLVAARHANVKKVVLWSQTLLYGAHPSNPNYLSERHPLRAPSKEGFFADKIAAEAEAERFAQKSPGAVVTVLRTAPILGPTVRNFVTRYLARKLVPTMMGFDPLVQFLHEADALAAFKIAIVRSLPGTFNIVGDGVLPLSTVIKLAGRVALPLPHPVAYSVARVTWLSQLGEAPPSFLKYLRFVCVADGQKARDEMGFHPAYTSREALVDFTNAQRLRDTRLLQEASP
jgi:UDP-glucose 4-epimerase